jgi:hypothetical protein
VTRFGVAAHFDLRAGHSAERNPRSTAGLSGRSLGSLPAPNFTSPGSRWIRSVDGREVTDVPKTGTVKGVTPLNATAYDSAGITKVVYEFSGGPSDLTDQVIAAATPTIYGWLAQWNSTSVPDGGYNVVSVGTDSNNVTYTSLPDPFAVSNCLPTTSMLVPSNAGTVSGHSSVLDASASPNVSTVTYKLSGNGLAYQTIADGTLTAYGWLSTWDTTTVPNGTYTVTSDATYPNGQNALSNPVDNGEQSASADEHPRPGESDHTLGVHVP